MACSDNTQDFSSTYLVVVNEKLAALTQTNHGAAPAWLLSHPKPDERIAAIRRLSDGWSDA